MTFEDSYMPLFGCFQFIPIFWNQFILDTALIWDQPVKINKKTSLSPLINWRNDFKECRTGRLLDQTDCKTLKTFTTFHETITMQLQLCLEMNETDSAQVKRSWLWKIERRGIMSPTLDQSHFFIISIHSMQGWTATTRHGVTRKRSTKGLKHTGNLFRKNLS